MPPPYKALATRPRLSGKIYLGNWEKYICENVCFPRDIICDLTNSLNVTQIESKRTETNALRIFQHIFVYTD